MTTKKIVISDIQDVNTFANLCTHCGVVEVSRGRWNVDGSSIMGLMSLNLAEGVKVTYDESCVNPDFVAFIDNHIC